MATSRGRSPLPWVLVLALALASALAACEGAPKRAPPPRPPETTTPPPATEPPPSRTRGGESPPQHHVWALLTEMGGEEPGYGMYTYVLFARRVRTPGLDPDIRSRYESLLSALAASTLSAGEAVGLPRAETNVFLVPARARGKQPSLANYDEVLSLRYLAVLGRLLRGADEELARRLGTRPGPFLISTLRPAAALTTGEGTVLYADLSTTNPGAMAEVVSAYKRRVGAEHLAGVERFAPFRLALLNLVLNADDNVRLVRTAVAEWVPGGD
ncbi:MAG: hypothetical protein Kow0092_35400 [Deferrisomatales bacterium]